MNIVTFCRKTRTAKTAPCPLAEALPLPVETKSTERREESLRYSVDGPKEPGNE